VEDFVYSEAEFAEMKRSIGEAKQQEWTGWYWAS
jgi:hypothetical protein